MEKQYLVYKLKFPNGKYYIGMTSKTIKERYHFYDNHNPNLAIAKKQYRYEYVEKEIVKDGLTREEASELEIQTIRDYDSTNPNKGYNVSYGGILTFQGLKHTEESKRKIRQGNIGRYVSEETRKKLSISHKGKNVGEKNHNFGRKKTPEEIQKQYNSHRHEMKPVVMIDESGNEKVFDSLHQAQKETGIFRSLITHSIKTGKPTKGTRWIYLK